MKRRGKRRGKRISFPDLNTQTMLLRCILPIRGSNRPCNFNNAIPIIEVQICTTATQTTRNKALDTCSGLTPDPLVDAVQHIEVTDRTYSRFHNTQTDKTSTLVIPAVASLWGLEGCPEFKSVGALVDFLESVTEKQLDLNPDKRHTLKSQCILLDLFERAADLDDSDSWKEDRKTRSPLRASLANVYLALRYGVDEWAELPVKVRAATMDLFLDETCGLNYCWLLARDCKPVKLRKVSGSLIHAGQSLITA